MPSDALNENISINVEELKEIIRKHALDNALRYNGKASPGSVIGKVIAELPGVKKYMKTVSFEAGEIISEISLMTLDSIRRELEEKYPQMLEEKERVERDMFAFLKIDSTNPVITGFPPGPEKYPHIGHAKACLINYLLAKQYNGKFILRFEDTNPKLVQEEFYEIMQENFKWLGVEWDTLLYASDFMELFYRYAEQVIREGNAYMCFCGDEDIKSSRSESKACTHRNHTIEENLHYWKEFPTYNQGKAILRLKIDLDHQNTTMRDPAIFRIIDTSHARHGTKYRIWPNYDFQNAIMDSYSNITIRLRSKEFEMRNELQRYIQNILGLKSTRTYEFARFNLEGVESAGRVIREKIANKEFVGWDDPRLTTIVALRRRGFLPDAIKNFVIATGITKAESRLTWDDLIVQNKRILDRTSKRFFMMHDYEQVTIHSAPALTAHLKYHPDEESHDRLIDTEKDFLILKSDLAELRDGNLYRLMDCLNFRKNDGLLEFDSLEYEKYKSEGKKIMHWLPAYGNVDVEILMDDASIIKGVAEHNISLLKIGDIVQFERFGFCRLDNIVQGKGRVYKFWFTHK